MACAMCVSLVTLTPNPWQVDYFSCTCSPILFVPGAVSGSALKGHGCRTGKSCRTLKVQSNDMMVYWSIPSPLPVRGSTICAGFRVFSAGVLIKNNSFE